MNSMLFYFEINNQMTFIILRETNFSIDPEKNQCWSFTIINLCVFQAFIDQVQQPIP